VTTMSTCTSLPLPPSLTTPLAVLCGPFVECPFLIRGQRWLGTGGQCTTFHHIRTTQHAIGGGQSD
jgi:hypothetical protein